MKDEIFKTIRLQSGKVSFKNLLKKFDIDTEELRSIILELKLEGKVLQAGNKYMVFPKNLKMGKIIATSTGRKYISYNDERIPISSNYLNKVILNDVVAFKLDDKFDAEVVSIVDRTLGKMTCEIKTIGGKKRVIPYHSGISFLLPNEVMDTLMDGDIILVDTTPNELEEYSDAKFIKKIGRIDDPSMEDIAIALNYQFDNDYSYEYMEEVSKYPTYVSEDEIDGRYDFRNQASFTIDGRYTKDMDDGVYAERLDNDVIRVYVHIADVSHYVKPGTRVFERACEKATSLYMNNSVFHMLHRIISNGICSLNPGVDRLTKTVIMDISPDGKIVDYNIVKSAINSKMKMVYDDVDKVILNEDIPDDYVPFINTIQILSEAALRLERKYVDINGKITFANNELNIIYNHDGTIDEIHDMDYSPARKIIEYLMIAANETVANWLYYMDMPTVYRVHEMPNIDKVNGVIDKLNNSGLNVRYIRNVDSPKAIQKMLNKLRDYSEFPIISQMLVMSMQRARYSTQNVGHYALGSDAYLHFTSPIRRLPDLLVHTVIDLIIDDNNKLDEIDMGELEEKLKELAVRSSRMERQADMAEAVAERGLIIKKLAKLTGEELEATICEIDKKIKIKVDGVDTYIDKNWLSDNFLFDSKRKLYYDKDTNTYLKLGTKVIVKLLDVNTFSNSFNVMVLATSNNSNVKKKVLSK